MFEKINNHHPVIILIKNLLISYWRSFLLVLIGVYLPLQIATILAIQIWQNKDGFSWDMPILMAIHSTANTQLDAIAVVLTKWGSLWITFPILMAIAVAVLREHKWRKFAYLLTTAIGNLIINRTAKELIHRVRPHLWISKAPESNYAFPSGHAMTSMTLVMILLVLSWYSPWRRIVLTVGSFYVLVIAWTRLYLGVHFPSDILGGWMVALAWAIGISLIIKPNSDRVTALNSSNPTRSKPLF